jgi:hypothetical protein
VAAANRVIRIVAEDKASTPSPATDSFNTLTGTGTRPTNNSLLVTPNVAIRAGQLVMLGSGEQAYASRIASYNAGTIVLSDAIDTAITAYIIYLDSHQKASHSVDVVPYITGIENTVAQTTGLSTDVLRGANGTYSIEQHASNTFKVSGFNLGGAGYLPSSRVSAAPITAPSGTTPVTTLVNSNELTISKAAVNLGRSGYYTVFVNTVPSINIEYVISNPRSNKWTDTRYLWVWFNTQLNGANFNNQTYYYPDMMMEGVQPIFSYTNDNDGYTYRTTNDTTTTAKAGLWYERQTALAYADAVYWILSVEDAFSGVSIGFLQLNRDATGGAAVGTAGNNFIEIIGEDFQSRQLNRFKYPKLIAETSAGNDANIYISYYDDEASQKNLTFISFQASAANATNMTQATNDNTRASPVVVIPGTASASSQFYDMAKLGTTGGLAVAYYDETNSILKLAWSANAYVPATNLTNAAATWNTITVDANLFTGSHVSMVASGTKLYLAYYDSGDANLKFARIAWDGSATAPVVDGVVFVDKYLSIGSWTNIQLIDRDGVGAGTAQPHITYYSDSYNGTRKSLRMAYPNFDATSGAILHGVTGTNGENETYSGSWEIIAVPTLTTPKGGMEQFNHMQIGQYPINTYNMPVVGWLGDKLEYAKLQPNN